MSTSILRAAEFYTMQLAQLADGTISISLTATAVDQKEPELLNQEIVSERVVSLDEALALIKQSVTSSS